MWTGKCLRSSSWSCPGVTSSLTEYPAKTLNVGKTFQLAAWPQPTNATNKAVTFTSSDKTVAEVDSRGVVTGLKAGDVTICPAGTGHSIANKGDETLELIAVIVYA